VTTTPSFSIAFHGFLRTGEGRITTFDVPGAEWTFALSNSINPAGEIAGYYEEADNVFHGFLRARDGTFITFDVPGAGTGAFQGTGGFEVAINPAGAITGTYVDSNSISHGFVRSANGTITEFDPTGSVSTNPASINPAEAITGSYLDANDVSHGFLLEKH
ncbi:MAG: hypothetical protein JOZ33_02895, partial [Acidobacteriaceae bacterium]|nr:hypothetical protein [Acidobacteriaceae bacterium]